jgi:YfiH family protein
MTVDARREAAMDDHPAAAPRPIEIRAPALDEASVRHGFFGRAGGVSAGIYSSLNCGFGSSDDRAAVAENRARCATALGVAPEALVTVHQVHGVACEQVTHPWEPADAPRADAMVTAQPGIALGILTADCCPILLADAEGGVVGAAHAGWKGAEAGVMDEVVAAMVRLGAARNRIVACVGPTIGLDSYEVGPEFRESFLAGDAESGRFFATTPNGRPRFDLQGFVAARLGALGVAKVDRIEADTCADPERFFSYRRACHRGEADYGRQLSAIVLNPRT